MKYLKAFLYNIMMMILVFVGMLIFAKIFYPATLSVFSSMAELFSGLKFWPIIILLLIIGALPKRR